MIRTKFTFLGMIFATAVWFLVFNWWLQEDVRPVIEACMELHREAQALIDRSE